ncbi:hypothetical protein U1Q18_015315, partial [Sarracenia purpurea var. burkii]
MVCEKKIVEEVSGWLRMFDDGSVDRTWTGPPEVKFMTEPVRPHQEFIDGVATRDVTIDLQSGLRVRIYLPEGTQSYRPVIENERLPILLHFHGGGFCISQPDWYMYYHIYTRLARSAKAICVSVYLRLAPEHRLPAACDDGWSSLLWLRSLAKEDSHEPWLNAYADFNRVFLIGDSSGGNLVHDVAARAGKVDLSPVRLAGAIPIHPGFVRSKRSRSELEQVESPLLTLDMVDKFLGMALPVGSTKDHPITCPMGNVAPPIAAVKLPPILFCVAEKDLIRDTEMEYYEAAKKANKDLELMINSGMGHSFYLNKIAVDMDPQTAAESEKLIAGIVDFSWSAMRRLQAIGNNLAAPGSSEIVATSGLTVTVFTLNSVLLFAMRALASAILCQDRGLQAYFSIPRQFTWAAPVLSPHSKILEESKNRDQRNACGSLKEIIQNLVHLCAFLWSVPVARS